MTKETTWVEWLTGRLKDWLSGWLAAEWQTNWITDWLTDWLSDWLLTDGLPDWLINWMTEWMADRLTGWHTDLSLVKIDKICLVWVSLVALTCCSQNDIAPQTYLGQRHLPVEAKLRQETEASPKRRPYDICKYKNNVYQWRIYIPIDPQFKTSSQAYDSPHHSNIGFLTDDNATSTSSRGGPLYEFLGTSISSRNCHQIVGF